jgi:hypothetical protein
VSNLPYKAYIIGTVDIVLSDLSPQYPGVSVAGSDRMKRNPGTHTNPHKYEDVCGACRTPGIDVVGTCTDLGLINQFVREIRKSRASITVL